MLPTKSLALILPFALTDAATFIFKADSTNLTGLSDNLPTTYDLGATQMNVSDTPAAGGSFWSSSFVRASNGHDYMVVSHVLAGAVGPGSIYRASVTDITDPSYYYTFSKLSDSSDVYSATEVFNASFGDWGMGSTSSKDPISRMRTFSTVENVQFDITFETSSPVLLNGGLGVFQCGSGLGHEWSMPAGKTTGSLTIGGKKLSIVSDKSLTWYDRQWGTAPNSWTWFELHLDNGVKMSVWNWDKSDSYAASAFATVRQPHGVQAVVPVVSLQKSKKTWTSSVSGFSYPVSYILTLEDGTKLKIANIRGDAELVAPDGAQTTYEGFITVNGIYKGSKKVRGFGLVEVEPTTS